MAFIGETIYEDYLYKFTGKSRSILWGKGNPWRQKYFVIKRVGNKPVLEFFNKKPKNKNTLPKGKVELWPSFRVEKVTNMKNRAYVFQITTPDTTICLSTDEQRTMDIFVFFLQIQTRLKDQIRDDYFTVHPENSEAQRRIGAKGTNCVMHVSPYGITLALQSNRAVLAQWPLKSIRSYESSEQGQLSLEAGRVAPMGDGLYIFRTELGDDNQMYDLIDRYVLDALEQVQPGLRGGSEEIEDYVIEAERLLSLTVVSACTADNPDIRSILRENWSTDVQTQGNARPRQVVHTRLVSAESLGSLNSQNSFTGPQSVPARLIHDNSSARNSPQVPRSLPAFQNSPSLGPRRGINQSQSSLQDRPPAPPPPPAASTIPLKIPQRTPTQTGGQYLRMNSAASRASSTSGSPFTPTSADWVPPPSFRDAMRQKSTSPIAENGPYNPDAYLTPTSPGAIVTSTPIKKSAGANNGIKEQYLTPLSVSEDSGEYKNNSAVRPKEVQGSAKPVKKELKLSPKNVHASEQEKVFSAKRVRSRRLRSASCEDLSDYLRLVVYDPVSKSMNDLLDSDIENEEGDYLGPEPFPRLQSFSGVIETDHEHDPDNYYNIEGLKGKIYDGPGLPFAELRKRFSKKSLSRMRRSVSNPNFIGSLSLEKLNSARVSIGITSSSPSNEHHRSSSLANILPEALKKHLTKDSSHKGSHSALSSGAASKNSSHASSRASSAHTSPYNSLSRKHKHMYIPKEDIVGTTSVKGINITKRSRSFRKQKPVHEEHSKLANETENQSVENTDHVVSAESNHEVNKNESDNPELKARGLNDKVTEENGAESDNEVKLTMSDISADSVASAASKPTPKIAPKPKPKPASRTDAAGNRDNATSTV